MRDPNQEELDLWPLPRWPTPSYLGEAFLLYASACLIVGILFFAAVVTVARPLWTVIFLAGVAAGILGYRACRAVLRRFTRLIEVFPRHA